MNLMIMAGVCLILLVFGNLLKGIKSEYGILLGVVGGIFLILGSLTRIGVLITFLESIADKISLERVYLETAFKIVGVSYICDFISDLCKDSGFGMLANQIQIFGKLLILALGLPVITALLETLNRLME